MWFKISQLKTSLEFDQAKLNEYISKLLRLPQLPISKIKHLKILHQSLDARHKEPSFVYTLVFEVDGNAAELESLLTTVPNLTLYQPIKPITIIHQQIIRPIRPVIVGAGPAGLFAGLRLAAAGFKPLIIERGDGLAERINRVENFWRTGELDPESNIQYGIGGAGTFSDGKLTTRIKDPALPEILEMIVKLGGPAEILYWQSPHIGTDLLRQVVANLQKLIIEYGGEIRFRCKMTDIGLVQNAIKSVKVNHGEIVATESVLLAVGNSARDVYELLIAKGLHLTAKPFAIGLRIEHPQDLINKAQYGRWSGHPKLGPAEYRLTYQHPTTGRGVYTFCMCPGGSVIGAASEPGRVVTNGMSLHARNSGIANSAIIVTVGPRDFGNDSPLAGIKYQRSLEEKAFLLGGSNYFAPAQKVGDFLKANPTNSFKDILPSYRPWATPANLGDLLPLEIGAAIREGIKDFGRKLKGFDWPEAVLTGVETRTSAPVRILRNEAREAEGIQGIFPVGEGAGYAGGIISSALDGWKTAEELIAKYGGD